MLAINTAHWFNVVKEITLFSGRTMQEWAEAEIVPDPNYGLSRKHRAAYAVAVTKTHPNKDLCPTKLQGWWESGSWILGN